jgi:cytochrome c oxidase subunit II
MDPTSWRYWLPLPPEYSTHAAQVDHLIWFVHVLMLILFVCWGAFFTYCLIRFRQRAGHKAMYEPVKAKVAKYAEYGVIVVEAFMLIGLSMPVWASYKNDLPARSEALEVKVTAEQFAWNFHYAGPDGKFGKTDVKFIDNFGNAVGLDPNDPVGKDDILSLNELHVPVNKPVILDITSKDVIHSFTVNVLRVKQDAVPGMMIPIHFQATPNSIGQYDISCAQLCGLGHYRMRGSISIDSPTDYAKWVSEQEAARQGGNQ